MSRNTLKFEHIPNFITEPGWTRGVNYYFPNELLHINWNQLVFDFWFVTATHG